jgi:hypothetical protein
MGCKRVGDQTSTGSYQRSPPHGRLGIGGATGENPPVPPARDQYSAWPGCSMSCCGRETVVSREGRSLVVLLSG